MEDFNSVSYDIKFTYEFDKENMPFLDLEVISSNDKLMTSLYSKPTDCHRYLSTRSNLEHTKQSIIYSPTLRVKRVCSKLKSWFHKRGYTQKIIDTERKKVLGDSNRKVNNKTEKEIHGYL